MTQDDDEKSIEELAGEYLSSLEREADQEEMENAQKHLAELQERHERFNKDYGESDPATQELAERVSEAQERVDQLEEAQQVPEKLEEQILERATEFILTDEWLESDVIEALNRALIGEDESTLVIEEVEIAGQDDVEDLDDVTRFDIIDVVRKLAMDKLDESEALKDVWDSIEGTTKEAPFRIAARRGYADPDEVLEEIDDDDVSRENVRDRLKNTVRRSEINPYDRQDGVYHLATAGKYLAKEYVDESPTTPEDTTEEEEEDGQTTLDQEPVVSGGDPNE